MIFTDPPYGVDYEGKTKAKLKIKNDAMSEDDLSVFWESAYSLMREFLKDGGSVYVTVPAGPLHLLFVNALKKFGDLRQILVWSKNNFVLGRSDYHYQHEPILYGWKEGAKHTWYGGRTKNSVWNFDKPARSDMHPTMKPVELICEAIKNSTSEHDIVIDFFGGSGSTLIACEKTNRSCCTMELDERYASVILQRWEETTGQAGVKL
jgi:DNA modification methylase